MESAWANQLKKSNNANQGTTPVKPENPGRTGIVDQSKIANQPKTPGKWVDRCTQKKMEDKANGILEQWDEGSSLRGRYELFKGDEPKKLVNCREMFLRKTGGSGDKLPLKRMYMKIPLSKSPKICGTYPIDNAIDIAAALMTMDFEGKGNYTNQDQADEAYCALLFSFGDLVFGKLKQEELEKKDYSARVVSRLTITFDGGESVSIWGASASGAIGKGSMTESRASYLKKFLGDSAKQLEVWKLGNCAEWATFGAAVPDDAGTVAFGQKEAAPDGASTKAFGEQVVEISTKAWKAVIMEEKRLKLVPMEMCDSCQALSKAFKDRFAPRAEVVDEFVGLGL